LGRRSWFGKSQWEAGVVSQETAKPHCYDSAWQEGAACADVGSSRR
jgi:hypothetical protein